MMSLSARAYLKLRLCLHMANATRVIFEPIITAVRIATLIFLEIKLYKGLHSECVYTKVILEVWDIHRQ